MLTAHGSELEMGDAHPTVARENDTSSSLPPPPPPPHQLNLEIRIMVWQTNLPAHQTKVFSWHVI